MLQLTTNKNLNELANIMIDQGFKLIVPTERTTYFFFMLDGRIGYLQNDGYKSSGSRSYVPSSRNWSGQGVFEKYFDEVTMEDVRRILRIGLQSWIEEYKDLEHFLKGHTWHSLDIIDRGGAYTVLKK